MDRKKTILVVDDERDLTELLAVNLTHAGHRVHVAFDGLSALKAATEQRPDLVVLDVMLPGLSGTEVASRLRSNPLLARIPIILLTAKADEVDQVVGFTVGADDYVTKPFSMKVLLARVEALLRRTHGAPTGEQVLSVGEVQLDPSTHEAKAGGREVRLTLTEFRLLLTLFEAKGRVLNRNTLMSRVIGPGIVVTDRTIDVHVTSIRKKLGRHGHILRTVRGVGYRATVEPEAVNS